MIKKKGAVLKKWLLAAVVAGSLVLLSACTVPMQEAGVKTVDLEGLSLPEVSGFINNEEINRSVHDIFLPYADRYQALADESDGALHIVYSLTRRPGIRLVNPGYQLSMQLSDGQGSIELMRADIEGFGSVVAEEAPTLSWLSSARMAESYLALDRIGMNPDMDALEGNADERFVAEKFIEMYEAIAEKKVDVSDVVLGSDEDITHKKALKLGLVAVSDNSSYYYDEAAYLFTVESMASAIMNDVERDVYGRQSEAVTGEEFAAMIRAFHGACAADDSVNPDYAWSALAKVDTDAILAEMQMTDTPFTRRDGAELVCRITQTGPKYGMNYRDNGLNYIDDSDSIWVRRAATHYFMNNYGESDLFAPDEDLTVISAVPSARTYVMTRCNDWLYAVDYAWDGVYSQSEVMMAVGQIAAYFNDRPEEDKYNFEVKTVINDRDYDWFYSQKNTGVYSDVNCMPSIATMAAHWYDRNSSATVSKMRETSEEAGGWTALELRGGLDAYHVPYEVADNDLDTILGALDDGKIILAQYSDRPRNMTGHCYVIYGYRKFKDSVTFIVNDSDALGYRATIFGRPMGNGDEIDSKLSLWSIRRFVYDVTVVG